jgi:hypothetical protein
VLFKRETEELRFCLLIRQQMKEYYNITFDENGFEEKSDMML